jgi:hypothetical protein
MIDFLSGILNTEVILPRWLESIRLRVRQSRNIPLYNKEQAGQSRIRIKEILYFERDPDWLLRMLNERPQMSEVVNAGWIGLCADGIYPQITDRVIFLNTT